MGVFRNNNGDTRQRDLGKTVLATPTIAAAIEIRVRRNAYGNAACTRRAVTSIAIPTSRRATCEKCAVWHNDGCANRFFAPITARAFPIVTPVVEKGVGRNDDSLAVVVAWDESTVAIPARAAAILIEVAIFWNDNGPTFAAIGSKSAYALPAVATGAQAAVCWKDDCHTGSGVVRVAIIAVPAIAIGACMGVRGWRDGRLSRGARRREVTEDDGQHRRLNMPHDGAGATIETVRPSARSPAAATSAPSVASPRER